MSLLYSEQKLSDVAFADDESMLDIGKEKLQKATDENEANFAKAGLCFPGLGILFAWRQSTKDNIFLEITRKKK